VGDIIVLTSAVDTVSHLSFTVSQHFLFGFSINLGSQCYKRNELSVVTAVI
jgi:hypothetical protein